MSSTPDVSATPLQKLPALLKVWRFVYFILGAIVGLAAGGAFALLLTEWDIETRLLYACVLLPAIALGAFGWLYAGKRYAAYHAHVHAGQGVVLHDGVWWRTEAWVPIARLQHIDVSQGPLDRRWGMAALTLQTASSHDHATRIAGLPVGIAHALRAALLPQTPGRHE